MDLLIYPAFGFIVILLAAFLLFTEFLVKAKGIAGLIGSGLFIFYFSYFLTDQASPWIVVLLVSGLFLIILDGKLLTTGIIGIMGLGLMVLGCALPAPDQLYGLIVSIAFIIGTCSSFFSRKILPRRDYLEKLTLPDQLTSDEGYNSINQDYHRLVGRKGVTVTPFHPVGTIRIEGRNYSAVTDGIFLKKGESIRVVSVDGTRIVIEQNETATESDQKE